MKTAVRTLQSPLSRSDRGLRTWNFAHDAVMEYRYSAAAGIESPLYGIAAITKSAPS